MNTRKQIMRVALEARPNGQYSRSTHEGSVKIKQQLKKVRNFHEAANMCKSFISLHDLGAGNWSGGQIFENGVQVAHVTYNGKIFWGEDKAPVLKEVHFYKAFPSIPIPQRLDTETWSDASWGNDATARSQFPLDDHHTIEVWVHPFHRSHREDGERFRYLVGVYNDGGEIVCGGVLRHTDKAEEIMGFVYHFIDMMAKERTS